jgi:protease-4
VVVLVLLLLALLLARGGGPQVEPGSTLVLELAGDYIEAPAPPLISRLMGDQRQPFVGLLSTLAMAERDPRLSSMVLRIRRLGVGWGKAQEIRDAIGRVRAAGIEAVAHLELADFGVSREFYIASSADRIYATPGSIVPVVGLAAEYLFLGGLWEKLGLEIEVERIGKYKSAVDSLTGREMSEAHREMANSLLDSIHEQFVNGIAVGRGLSEEEVHRAIDAGPVTPEELRFHGLIDGVRHLDELEEMSAPTIEGGDYARVDPSSVGFQPEAQFALIYGTGNVVSGKGRSAPGAAPVFASEVVSAALRDAAKDPEIDAIILRIDSPGGSSLASEVIWRAMQGVKQSGKPLIASFSDLAASGGYYVGVGADRIVTPPGALTGSIGVFVLRPVLGGIFERLGIGLVSLTRGQHADFLLSGKPLSPGARERLRGLVVDTYDLFVKRVAEARALEPARVDAIGQGRVWTGAQAARLGLVDELGGLHAAVDAGRSALGLEEDADVALVPYPGPLTLAEELAELLQGRVASLVSAKLPLPDLARKLESWLLELPTGSPLLVPPVVVEIH